MFSVGDAVRFSGVGNGKGIRDYYGRVITLFDTSAWIDCGYGGMYLVDLDDLIPLSAWEISRYLRDSGRTW